MWTWPFLLLWAVPVQGCRWLAVRQVERATMGGAPEIVRSQGDTVVVVMFCAVNADPWRNR